MTVTPLFVVLLCAGSALATWSWRAHQLQKKPRTSRGPVPGYSMTKGSEVSLLNSGFEGHPPWTLESLEEFHTANRARLVFTLVCDADGDLVAIAHDVAFEAQARSHAHAILTEIFGSNGARRLRHLYAPDGQGWSGEETTEEVFDAAA